MFGVWLGASNWSAVAGRAVRDIEARRARCAASGRLALLCLGATLLAADLASTRSADSIIFAAAALISPAAALVSS